MATKQGPADPHFVQPSNMLLGWYSDPEQSICRAAWRQQTFRVLAALFVPPCCSLLRTVGPEAGVQLADPLQTSFLLIISICSMCLGTAALVRSCT